jgi:hypothetical protein
MNTNKEKEIWVDCKPHRPDFYEVSNTGKLRNKATKLILKTRINKYGYEDISFGQRKNNYRTTVHRLIYQSFNLEVNINGFDMHHKDGNKLNNHISNLAPISKGDHTRNHVLGRFGKKARGFKGTVGAFNKKTGELVYLLNGRADMEKHGFLHSGISSVICGKSRQYKGFMFKRVNESDYDIGKIYDTSEI